MGHAARMQGFRNFAKRCIRDNDCIKIFLQRFLQQINGGTVEITAFPRSPIYEAEKRILLTQLR